MKKAEKFINKSIEIRKKINSQEAEKIQNSYGLSRSTRIYVYYQHAEKMKQLKYKEMLKIE